MAAKPPHPIVKADAIDAARITRRHFLNNDAVRSTTCISDMAGMQGNNIGVHHVRVDPNKETTEMHHHINEWEWLYIIKGSATVRLTAMECDSARIKPAVPHAAPVEEHEVGPGDFMGFPGGLGAQYAHTMVAGPEGLEYLVGGGRGALDICMYPMKDMSLVIEGGGARAVLESKNLLSQK